MAEKKKGEHYVNNKEFYAAMVEYKAKCDAAALAGLPVPRIPNYIGLCIYKIAAKLGTKYNFANYSYNDEMISDGIESAISNVHKFDTEKYSNPFAYFTQIIWNSFVQRIAKEKKQQYIKFKSLENAIISNDQFVFQDSDDKNVGSSGYNEAAIHVISSFENTMKKKKDAAKSKKALDAFVDIDIEEEEDV